MKDIRIRIVCLAVCCLVFCSTIASATQIQGVNIPDADPSTKVHEITLEQAFDTAKLGNRTVTVDGKSQKDVLVVSRSANTVYITSLGDDYNNNLQLNKSFDQFVKDNLNGCARTIVMAYPGAEVVSINGVAWQKSEWGDYLKERIEYFLDEFPNEKLSKNLKDWEIAQNPIYNGLGDKIADGKLTLAQAKAKGEKLQGDTAVVTPVGENITLTMFLNDPKYTVKTKDDTVTKTLDVAPFAKYGVTLVPVRGVFESFDAKVEWLPASKEVRVTKGDDLIILKINSKTATVNGKSVKLLQPAQIVKGRTMIPLRFISENIGYNVTYISKTKQIVITD